MWSLPNHAQSTLERLRWLFKVPCRKQQVIVEVESSKPRSINYGETHLAVLGPVQKQVIVEVESSNPRSINYGAPQVVVLVPVQKATSHSR